MIRQRNNAAIVMGYAVSVGAASITYALCQAGIDWSSGFEAATGSGLGQRLSDLIRNASLYFAAFFLICGVSAAIPFFITVNVAKELRTTNVVFFGASGVVTATVLAPVYAFLIDLAPVSDDALPSSHIAHYLPVLLLAGFIGAVAFWLVQGRDADVGYRRRATVGKVR